MKKIQTLLFLVGFLLAIGGYQGIYADGCYICGSGSSSNCKDYCRYSGSDTWENRKKCKQAGCKVTGTASCPTAANYKVCNAHLDKPLLERLARYFHFSY